MKRSRPTRSTPRLVSSLSFLQWALSGPGHAVQFYDSDVCLQEVVTDFFEDGLRVGQPVVSIATRSHTDLFVKGLTARGFDVGALEASGQLSLNDADEMLDAIMAGRVPSPERLRRVVGSILERAGGRRRLVRAYEEMVDVLWKNGNEAAALELERMWNALAIGYHFALLCSYSIDNFMSADHVAGLEEVCGQHHHVIPIDRRAPSLSEDR